MMPGETESAIRPLQYPILSGAGIVERTAGPGVDLLSRVRELEVQLAEREARAARQIESARRDAAQKAREQIAAEHGEERKRCAEQVAAAIEEFRGRRDEYLGRVEQEVVRLALAVAERILHREAQMDPLLLAGAVRVALGQLADSTAVRLHVPAAQQELWAEMLRLMPALPLRPEMVADAELSVTEAFLEAAIGTVNLGVRAQIAEIERGFFDLLEAREDPRRESAPRSPGARGH